MSIAPLVEVVDVSRNFEKNQGTLAKAAARLKLAPKPERLRAVDRVSLQIHPGEVVGLAGESGCGKSTLGRMVIGTIPPTGGQLKYRGQELGSLSKKERDLVRLKFQMVFQDPFSSLNPRMRVGDIISE
ncbi:MAG: ATP-binding cassette domain-containing protein, partial [Roseibium sp.]|uniref:ATP-binding cassette domain-containing protein n=1 Tax=Roseibium sp. TaxID=1936156 RepID=UPI0026198727